MLYHSKTQVTQRNGLKQKKRLEGTPCHPTLNNA
jgi:hypothetical protein